MSNLKEPIKIILPGEIIEDYRNQILSSLSTCGYRLDYNSFNVMTYVKEYIKFRIEEMIREMGSIVIDLTLDIDFEKYHGVLNQDFCLFLKKQHVIEPDLLFLYPVITSIDTEAIVKVTVDQVYSHYGLEVMITGVSR